MKAVRRKDGIGRETVDRKDRLDMVGFGTMLFGELNEEKEAMKLLDRARERGISFFDTAEMYPVPQRQETQGLSEEIIGKWLKSRSIPRSEVAIATKVTGPSGQMSWIRDGPRRIDREAITSAVEGSLRRLDVDYIDVYQIHWPDRYVPMFGESLYDSSRAYSAVPLEEQMEAMGSLVQQGKIREVGLSNESPFGLMRCCNLAKQSCCKMMEEEGEEEDEEGEEEFPGKTYYPKISYIQNAYNLMCRSFDSSLLECCLEEKVKLLAYSPLAMGLLTGKYLRNGGPADGRLNLYKGRYSEAETRYEQRPAVIEAVKQYASVAAKHGMTPLELAIRFALSNPCMGKTIVGATNCSQLDEIVRAAGEGSLSEAVLADVKSIHRNIPNPTP